MPEGGRFSIETSQVTLTPEYGRFMTEVVARPGPYALLVVSDSGHGMDRRTLQQAFEPFFTTKPVGQGTGLGLSTVYGIVKQSGGYVWAYSEPGQGTTFKIYLPVDASAPSDVPQPPVAPSAMAGEVVMVVEDEESVRVMTGRLLESEGYDFVEAADGQDALELIRKGGRIDLVITDVAMPQMNGREFADQVQRLRPELPVLFMSGYTDDEMIRRGLLEPHHPFLSKPFAPEVLAAKVRQLIDRAARGSP